MGLPLCEGNEELEEQHNLKTTCISNIVANIEIKSFIATLFHLCFF